MIKSKIITLFEKAIKVVPIQEFDPQTPFTIFITNLGTVLQDLGPRPYHDDKHLPVYEVLGELEENVRIAFFQKRAFNQLEGSYVGNGMYAVFSFKELRKNEDGTYVAYYKYEYLTCDYMEFLN